MTGCWAKLPPLAAGAVTLVDTVMLAVLPVAGVMESEPVAGFATPAMLKPMVWAAALFKERFGVATPLAKSTLII